MSDLTIMTSISRSRFAAVLLPCLMLIVLASFALAQTPPVPTLMTRPANSSAPETVLPSEDTVNSFLFQTFGYDPAITWKIESIRPSEVPGLAEVMIVIAGPQGQNQNRILVSSDGKHAISGDILPFGAHPYDETRAKLEMGVNGPSRGPAKAAVMIVEFSDMQCPHCQKAAPAIEQLLALEPDARFVFQNFPLATHNWAEKAADYVDCLGQLPSAGKPEDAPVWKFIQKTFADQANITAANVDEKLKSIATAAGANAEEIAACSVKPETKARIEASIALGRSIGVSGTPMILINGRMVSAGAPVDMLKKVVDFEASQEKGAEKAKK